ncbi:MAG: hypothetical protein LPK45_04115, partial [Bacteroidota bacterium]|nr:hypothetical protein [Bacteroidota bacterium]MDX5430238.1 hypothetical protein [Bacteroidota bacterium]MDX5468999.1 hypothetical protein [Bacteroidota bacterium]
MPQLFTEIHRFKSMLSNRYEKGEADSITQLVFEELFLMKVHQLRLAGELELNPEQIHQLESVLSRLMTGEPIQYILGFAWFLGERYLVNESTLIPRPETEELVAWIAQDLSSHPAPTLLDLGTGSGCIPIALKRSLPKASVR